jgi:hypothetical protein
MQPSYFFGFAGKEGPVALWTIRVQKISLIALLATRAYVNIARTGGAHKKVN